MTTVNYYIEDIATGLVVTETADLISKADIDQAKAFGSYEHALAYIDALPNAEYKIFSIITKA